MSYQEQLSPWVVHKLMPNLQQAAIARFRHRNDAEAYLKLISQMMPHIRFTIAFDVHKKLCASSATGVQGVSQGAIAHS
ncbi:MAG: hypothetical protein AAFX78_13175 [Cyanobacteria bacterium J06638_20]